MVAFLIIFAISIQVTQQVYVVKDWVRNAHNKFDAETQSRHEVEKALGTANHEKTLLAEKLKAVESACQSAEVGLKTAEAQAEDQRKQLYTTQINLATEKAAVLDLKAKLQKAQETLKVAQEATKAVETTAYERGVLETEARLTAEVTVVCRDYCAEIYYQTLDRVGVTVDSDLRIVDQVYYPEDIREDPTALPPLAAFLFLLSSHLSPPKTFLRRLKYQQGLKKRKRGMWWSLGQKRRRKRRGRRRQRIKLMSIPSRMPLQLKIWCPRLKLLNPSPRLTPRKILINHRLRYRVLALFL